MNLQFFDVFWWFWTLVSPLFENHFVPRDLDVEAPQNPGKMPWRCSTCVDPMMGQGSRWINKFMNWICHLHWCLIWDWCWFAWSDKCFIDWNCWKPREKRTQFCWKLIETTAAFKRPVSAICSVAWVNFGWLRSGRDGTSHAHAPCIYHLYIKMW